MGAEDNGLTLEGLAHRLEALERENAALREELSALRGLETGRAAEGAPAEANGGKVSRRALLGKAGAAAVAAVAAGTLRSPREARAETFASVESNSFVSAATTVSGAFGTFSLNDDDSPAVLARNEGAGPGASGEGGHNGVRGNSTGSDGYGVEGSGDTGVHGRTFKTGYSGVYGLHEGTNGYGLLGDGKGPGAGVLGRNAGGAGVEERDSLYGGKFAGSRAQLLLVPKATAGKPTDAHAKGEISLDSQGSLFVCTRGGNPAAWRKVTTTAV